MSVTKPFIPWESKAPFTPNARQTGDGTFRLQQWPIKLWKAPVSSPYYHHAHLLVCADCVAFSYANYHETLSVGRIPLICCPENEYDLTSHLADIIKCNDIQSITVVRMDDSCCADLIEFVKRAVRLSQKAIPVQATTIFIDCEIMD